MHDSANLRKFHSFQKNDVLKQGRPSFDRFSNNDPSKLSHSELFKERFEIPESKVQNQYRARPLESGYKSVKAPYSRQMNDVQSRRKGSSTLSDNQGFFGTLRIASLDILDEPNPKIKIPNSRSSLETSWSKISCFRTRERTRRLKDRWPWTRFWGTHPGFFRAK